jgi:hypothetical protein
MLRRAPGRLDSGLMPALWMEGYLHEIAAIAIV